MIPRNWIKWVSRISFTPNTITRLGVCAYDGNGFLLNDKKRDLWCSHMLLSWDYLFERQSAESWWISGWNRSSVLLSRNKMNTDKFPKIVKNVLIFFWFLTNMYALCTFLQKTYKQKYWNSSAFNTYSIFTIYHRIFNRKATEKF